MYIAGASGGDVRCAYNILEVAYYAFKKILP